MAYHDNKYAYLTPDRKPVPDTPFKGLSTTDAKQIYTKYNPLASPFQERTELEGDIQSGDQQIRQKLKWFQMRAAELRVYLTESPKIERRKIKQIFDWGSNDGLDNYQEKKLLKELGSKVRGLIKENHELRHHLYSDDINELKIENQRLKRLVNIVNKGEEVREKILSEENQYMRNYIEQSSAPANAVQRSSTKNLKPFVGKIQPNTPNQQEEEEPKLPLFDAQPLSLERLKNLKKYFTLYINTTIQQNDEKLLAQQKYIDSLQKRISQLETIEQKIDHLQFQRKVKLQQSGKKVKNYTSAAPVVHGDSIESQIAHEQENQQKQIVQTKNLTVSSYFTSKQREEPSEPIIRKIDQNSQQLFDEILRLREENQKLKQYNLDLKEKYQIQLEKHIKDNVKKQEIQFRLQRLEAQHRQLTVKFQRKNETFAIQKPNQIENVK